MIGKIWAWLLDADWKTWVSRGAQGFLIVLVADVTGLGVNAGIYATVVHFGLREAPGIYFAGKNGQTDKLVDGLADFFAPIVGLALYALLFS